MFALRKLWVKYSTWYKKGTYLYQEDVLFCGLDLVTEDNEIWFFNLVILEVTDILTSNSIPIKSLEIPDNLIEQPQSLFIKLFDCHLKPKHHFLVHYPNLIKKFGSSVYRVLHLRQNTRNLKIQILILFAEETCHTMWVWSPNWKTVFDFFWKRLG